MTIRELITEYILFAFTEDELRDQFHISEDELQDIGDEDLLEIYDQTLLFHTIKNDLL
jgi:hypothetical protein